MASAVKNTLQPGGVVVPTLITKLTRGKNFQLGSIAAAGDVVAFSVPEPTRDNQGFVVIQVTSTVALVGPTFALEVSIDNAVSWAVLAPSTTLTLTGQPGGDTAAQFMATYQVAGMGAGAQFRFGLSAVTSGGPAAVFALVG